MLSNTLRLIIMLNVMSEDALHFARHPADPSNFSGDSALAITALRAYLTLRS